MRWARFFSNSRMNTATPTSTTIVRTALNVSTTPQPLSRRQLLGTRWERGDVPARARTRRLLEPGAHRGDALGVEAEPVHPADVTRVLDLHTTVHDHRHAPLLGRPRTLLVDHAELAPQGVGPDGDGVLGEGRERVGCTEDVHEVDVLGYVAQARVAGLTEDLGLARVH